MKNKNIYNSHYFKVFLFIYANLILIFFLKYLFNSLNSLSFEPFSIAVFMYYLFRSSFDFKRMKDKEGNFSMYVLIFKIFQDGLPQIYP